MLVASACCSLLALVVLPVLEGARKDKKSIECANQIRQICIAAHNYHDAYKRLPVSTIGARGAVDFDAWSQGNGKERWEFNQNTSSLACLGPFMELQHITERVDPIAFNTRKDLSEYVKANGDPVYADFTSIAGMKDIAEETIDVLICPADSFKGEDDLKVVISTQPILFAADVENNEDDMGLKFAPEEAGWAKGYTSYLANGGAGGGNSALNSNVIGQKDFTGPMFSRTKQTLETIRDGTSNTILFGESLGQIDDGRRTQVHSWVLGGQARGRGNIPWGKSAHPDDDTRRILGNANASSIYGFGSKHDAGVNFARADGSVSNLPRGIDSEVLYALLGMRDGIVVNDKQFDQMDELREESELEEAQEMKALLKDNEFANAVSQDPNLPEQLKARYLRGYMKLYQRRAQVVDQLKNNRFIEAVRNDPILSPEEKSEVIEEYRELLLEKMNPSEMIRPVPPKIREDRAVEEKIR